MQHIFSGFFFIDAKTDVDFRYNYDCDDPHRENDACCATSPMLAALHAMGNSGPVQSCLVWFQKSADAICTVCPT